MTTAATSREIRARRMAWGGAAALALIPLTILIIALVARANAYQHVGRLADLLCDPESMTLRNVRQGPVQTTGMVNARNRFGGYAGFTMFVADRATGEASIVDPDWPGACPHVWTADRTDLVVPNGILGR